MKFKIVMNRIFHTELEVEFDTKEEAMEYAESLQQGDIPDGAVQSDDFSIQEIES